MVGKKDFKTRSNGQLSREINTGSAFSKSEQRSFGQPTRSVTVSQSRLGKWNWRQV